MKTLFLDGTLSFITKYKDYTDEEITKLKYGLEGIYLTITKLVIMFILSWILHIFRELILLLMLFNVIRYFGFGLHAKKSSECLISSIILFVFLPYILLKLNISNNAYFLINGICCFLLFIFAPADTHKRPFPKTKKKLFRKIATTLISVIYLILGLYVKNNTLSVILLNSVIIETILVNPITYKLMGQPYNNYKNM